MAKNRRFVLPGLIIIILLILLLVVISKGFYRPNSLPQVTISYSDYDGASNSISLNVSGYSLETKENGGNGDGRESTESFAGLGQIPGPEKVLTDKAELSFKITNTREPEEIYIFSWPETVLEDSGIDLKSSGIPAQFEGKYKGLTHTMEGRINISSGYIYGIRLVWGEDWLDYNFQVN